MWSLTSLSIAFLALALLAFTDLKQPLLGFSPVEIACFLAFLALLSALAGRVFTHIRRHQPWKLSAAVALIFALLPAIIYVRQDDFAAYMDNWISNIQPGRVAENKAGELVTIKSGENSFTLVGNIDGYQTRFAFDTGATTVVLMHETAVALKIDVDNLEFSQPVYTANGRTKASPYRIKAITISSITEYDVPALIAQKGNLSENLLGMTFLNRLSSYEVRGNRLIFRKAN
ncbi:TIGR02281 family clan AA aspartic protease [Microvirga sp. W0021]|uniref:TIGR02281 family clan AA aspartic protease n=1 Tax=Hohaiivirga grylli TaxID=3133970 RepID=A0ABV0BIC6_9HYPH